MCYIIKLKKLKKQSTTNIDMGSASVTQGNSAMSSRELPAITLSINIMK